MRLRLRFGLRTLLIALSLLGVLLGIAGRWWLEDRRQQALVEQCLTLLSVDGQVQVSRDEVFLEFYGQLSPRSAAALCKADRIKTVEIHGPQPEELMAELRKGFAPFGPAGQPPDMWGRRDYPRFLRCVEDRGGTLPLEP